MKLFLIVITVILFTACSSDQDPSKQNKNETRKKETRTRVTEHTTPDLDSADPDLTPVSAEEDTTDLAVENTPNPAEAIAEDITKSEQQGLIPLEDIVITPPVPTPPEDIIPLDLTDDQVLVAQISAKYNHYLALRNAWEEDYAPQLEIFIEQATNQDFLDSIRYIQFHSELIPVTPAQIEDMQEQVQEGFFVRKEDRDKAEKAHNKLSTVADGFEAAINLSLQYAELAVEDPSILFAQNPEETPGEQADESEEPVVIVAENAQTIPEAIVPLQQPAQAPDTSVKEDSPVAQESRIVIAEYPAVADAEEAVDAPNEGSNANEEEDSADEEKPEVAVDAPNEGSNANEAEDSANEEKPEVAVDAPNEGSNANEAEDSANEEKPEVAADASAQDQNTNKGTVADSADVQSTEEETSVVDKVIASWNDFSQWVSELFTSENPGQWLVEPTTLSIPNTNTIVPEEETPAEETPTVPSNPAEAHQLINTLVDNVYQFAQLHGVSSVEELIPHLEEISNTPQEERTLEQSTLLNQTIQVAQSVEQMSNGDAADFVESSGYNSDRIPKGEVIMIVEMLSTFINVSEEQQESAVEEESGTEQQG
ncbi:MAG: hypothetical protein OXK80_06700 [Bdellovibrionales bacterium]|nr:hypothetical protein [Bdellovibrionales bacterium]